MRIGDQRQTRVATLINSRPRLTYLYTACLYNKYFFTLIKELERENNKLNVQLRTLRMEQSIEVGQTNAVMSLEQMPSTPKTDFHISVKGCRQMC